ncbi:hypothetical protein HMPREF9151_00020 [Hoylesella saccharolytica F0055]|uniref:Uncharacterized protein n=1 Tax=Hoylesella saccharolytica F0055 TaxID=1127699 RepID=L1NM10_9BACT|nr:hypothetical protein HMPREF9151_00020 [Hoylesella saccharolytica F0055]
MTPYKNSLHPYEIPIEGVFVCYFSSCAFCHSQNEDLWFLCSFLFRLFSAHERKERAADIPPVKYAVVYSF